MVVSRRRFTKVALLGGIAAVGAGGIGAILNYLYPRGLDRGEPTTVAIPADDVPPPGGTPLRNKEHRFYLVHLTEEDGRQSGGLQPGLLALSRGCPHMSGDCPVVWNAEYQWSNPLTGETVDGWMFCPCHGSTFTTGGVRVFGPSPRSLGAYRIEGKRGQVIVHLDELTEGGVDNGVEPLPWP